MGEEWRKIALERYPTKLWGVIFWCKRVIPWKKFNTLTCHWVYSLENQQQKPLKISVSQTEMIVFQPSMFRGELLVSGRVVYMTFGHSTFWCFFVRPSPNEFAAPVTTPTAFQTAYFRSWSTFLMIRNWRPGLMGKFTGFLRVSHCPLGDLLLRCPRKLVKG